MVGKEELPAFIAALNGAGLNVTFPYEASPFEAELKLEVGLETATFETKPLEPPPVAPILPSCKN